MSGVTASLAGRVVIPELLPFSLAVHGRAGRLLLAEAQGMLTGEVVKALSGGSRSPLLTFGPVVLRAPPRAAVYCRMLKFMPTALLPAVLLLAGAGPGHAGTYANPVLVETHEIRRSNPAPYVGTLGIGDPAVLLHGDKYYLYPTGDNHSYDVYVSDDLVHWAKGPKVFRSDERGVWAPDVFFSSGDATFYLYYTVNRRVGVAASDLPDGVFADRGILIADGIDAHLFQDDDGSFYLYYARYPNFAIFVQPMRSPVRTEGAPVELLAPSEAWEMRDVPVTEAPWMVKHQGVYYLLYSGGAANSEHYAIGYATARSPLGPFTKHRGNPIVRGGDGIFGPGHPSVVRDWAGDLWMIYHQQKDATRGWNRIICLDPLWFDAEGVLRAKASRGATRSAPATAAGNRRQ